MIAKENQHVKTRKEAVCAASSVLFSNILIFSAVTILCFLVFLAFLRALTILIFLACAFFSFVGFFHFSSLLKNYSAQKSDKKTILIYLIVDKTDILHLTLTGKQETLLAIGSVGIFVLLMLLSYLISVRIFEKKEL